MWVLCASAAARSCGPLCPQDTMEYKKKQRPLKIRMLDGTVKTVMVDDSKTVTDMLMTICARIGERKGQQRGKKGGGESGQHLVGGTTGVAAALQWMAWQRGWLRGA